MENIIMQSKKINKDKTMRNLWLSLVAILVVSLLIMVIKYAPVKKAQDIIISCIVAETDDYDEYKSNRKAMLEELANDFHTRSHIGGNDVWSNLANAYTDYLRALADLADGHLKLAGYGNKTAYTWVSYGTFGQFCLEEGIPFIIINLFLFVSLGIANVLYCKDKKTELSILDNVVIGKKSNGKTVQFLLKDIKSVETTKTQGLKITGAGIKYDIHLIQNAEEMKNLMMDMLAEVNHGHSDVAMVGSSVNDIKEYKKLLDAGIITQEEFDAKKKQLLGV